MVNLAGQEEKQAPRLDEATVQQIQLELIRRHQYNNFEGEKVFADLMAHRDWWEAVLMDTYGLASVRGLPGAGLIKLRDLADNFWNVDTLYILARDERCAHRLAALGEKWLADSAIVLSEEDTYRALGGSWGERRLVVMWWD